MNGIIYANSEIFKLIIFTSQIAALERPQLRRPGAALKHPPEWLLVLSTRGFQGGVCTASALCALDTLCRDYGRRKGPPAPTSGQGCPGQTHLLPPKPVSREEGLGLVGAPPGGARFSLLTPAPPPPGHPPRKEHRGLLGEDANPKPTATSGVFCVSRGRTLVRLCLMQSRLGDSAAIPSISLSPSGRSTCSFRRGWGTGGTAPLALLGGGGGTGLPAHCFLPWWGDGGTGSSLPPVASGSDTHANPAPSPVWMLDACLALLG